MYFTQPSLMYTVSQKGIHQTRNNNSRQILTHFQHSFTGRLVSKFVVKWLLKIPPNLKFVATLPCEIYFCVKIAIFKRYVKVK